MAQSQPFYTGTLLVLVYGRILRKATAAECADLVVEDVYHQEVTGIAKAVSQAKQDCRMRWEELPGKTCGGK